MRPGSVWWLPQMRDMCSYLQKTFLVLSLPTRRHTADREGGDEEEGRHAATQTMREGRREIHSYTTDSERGKEEGGVTHQVRSPGGGG